MALKQARPHRLLNPAVTRTWGCTNFRGCRSASPFKMWGFGLLCELQSRIWLGAKAPFVSRRWPAARRCSPYNPGDVCPTVAPNYCIAHYCCGAVNWCNVGSVFMFQLQPTSAVLSLSSLMLSVMAMVQMTGLGRVPVVVSSELAVVRKTGGYVDPDVVHKGVYSRAGDVYSFGVLLLEILLGKLAFSEETGMLVDWAGHFLQNRDRMMEIVDPTLKSATPLELYALCEIARLCVQRESSARPSMKTVLELLVQTLAIPAETAAPFNSPVTLRGLMEAYI